MKKFTRNIITDTYKMFLNNGEDADKIQKDYLMNRTPKERDEFRRNLIGLFKSELQCSRKEAEKIADEFLTEQFKILEQKFQLNLKY